MLALMVAAMGGTTAVAQTLRDASYNYMGKISPNGTVRDSKYNPVGYFNNDGTIANERGKAVPSVIIPTPAARQRPGSAWMRNSPA